MTRVPHILKPNHRSFALNHLIALDVAPIVTDRGTDLEIHRLRCGSAWYWSPARRRQLERLEPIQFARPIELWTGILDRLPSRSRAVVVAHRSSYAMRLLDMYRLLPRLGFTLKRLSLDEPPFMAHWVESCPSCELANVQAGSTERSRRRRGCTASRHRSIAVWCLCNYTEHGLPALAASVGLPHCELPTKGVSRAAWQAATDGRAAVVLAWFRSWAAWLTERDMGILSPTIGAQAWHAYRHRFMDTPIYLHAEQPVIDLERRGYHGGRCEVRLLGDWSGPTWTELDFNSLYPSVMASELMPTKLLTTRSYPSVEQLGRWLDRYCVVATVELRTDEPLFPVRRKGGLSFPVGQLTTTLCTPELRIAHSRGLVVGVVKAALYAPAVLFDRYVQTLWLERLAARGRGDRVAELCCKLLLNALYGKFAQRGSTWEERGDCPPDEIGQEECWDMRQERWRIFRSIAGKVWERLPAPEGDDSFPAIAGHITSAARVRLLGVLELVPRWSVAYIDTDGLIVDAEQLPKVEHLIAPDTLGALRVGRSSDELVVLGPKWLRHGDHMICKGAKLDAEWLTDRRLYQWREHGLAWSIEGNVVDRVIRQKVELNLRAQFDAGAVGDDGRVSPIVLH